ncbi:hypothetical protein [Paenimyroides aestuarii]|uniref:Uncharacterized protein n=1 Tax=Paenimyroides aestuarii TaxID=2968490 RepID=A0ABY5NR62_9FLAO|nr:hypothetical protein [Paenimyroides aestuarii]UUV20879.1 hypothetical protein NPX36_11195 [Paenimyroides aestuarii]
MKTVLFTEHDFKKTPTGFVYITTCIDAENRKFTIEALQADNTYKEVTVLTKAKNNIFEIHKPPFDGRILYYNTPENKDNNL